jgi:hypothetical protein
MSLFLKSLVRPIPDIAPKRIPVLVIIEQTDRRTVLESGHIDEERLEQEDVMAFLRSL